MRRSHGLPAARSSGPVTPSPSSVSASSGQVPRRRCSTISLEFRIAPYSSARLGMIVEELAQLRREPGGDVLDHAADLEVARVHARAGGHLEQVEDQLALAQAVQEYRARAEVQRARAEPDQVRGDAVQLEVDHAQVLRAPGNLDLHQRLDRAAERHRVEVVREVVHPLDDRDDLPVGLVLGGLLDPRVHVPDDRFDVPDDLPLQRHQQAQHAVRGGVVRAEVERQQLVASSRRLPAVELLLRRGRA